VVLMEWALKVPGPLQLEKLKALVPIVPPKTSPLPLPPVEFTTAGREGRRLHWDELPHRDPIYSTPPSLLSLIPACPS
jgi:hypothetical protein